MNFFCTAFDADGCPILGLPVLGMVSEDEALEDFDWMLYHHYQDTFEKTVRTTAREIDTDEEI